MRIVNEVWTLCDFPNCNEPATNLDQVTAVNTGVKFWLACERHRAIRVEEAGDE